MNRLKSRIIGLLNSFSSATVPAALFVLAVVSFVLTLVCEGFGRRSLTDALAYMIVEPGMFFCNLLIILFTLSLSLFFRRRLIVLMLLGTVWFGLGLANGIVLTFRSSPLSAIDFLIIRSAIGMVTLYLTVLQIILISVLCAAFLCVLVLLYRKCPLCRVSYRHAVVCVILIGLSAFGATASAADKAAACESEDLPEIYDGLGFAYCFTQSLVSQGVDRPDDYDPENVNSMIDALEEE